MSEPPRAAFFNHKGGVGKTVLTANLSHSLADSGYSVLIVDADPQCNITSYLLSDDKVDHLLDTADKPIGRTLYSAVRPLADGKGSVRYVEPVRIRPNLKLLPGDIQLFRFEDDLNDYWADSFRRKLRGFDGMAAISDVVTAITKRHEFDFIFYDCGPNIGPLNRAILLDCDGFIVPVACDLFSVRALKTLGQALVEWISEWQTIIDLAPADVELLIGRPRLLGFVPQRFRTYGGAPESHASAFIARLERTLLSEVAKPLRAINPELVISDVGLKLGEVRDLGNLVAMSLTQRKSLWKTTGSSADKRVYAEGAFDELGSEILKRLS